MVLAPPWLKRIVSGLSASWRRSRTTSPRCCVRRLPGDTVGILLLNSQKYVTTLLGVWKAGKTPVPLNYLLPPQELAYIIKDSGMSALITSQFFAQAVAAVKPLFGDRA